jgi:hypothetical protein
MRGGNERYSIIGEALEQLGDRVPIEKDVIVHEQNDVLPRKANASIPGNSRRRQSLPNHLKQYPMPQFCAQVDAFQWKIALVDDDDLPRQFNTGAN